MCKRRKGKSGDAPLLGKLFPFHSLAMKVIAQMCLTSNIEAPEYQIRYHKLKEKKVSPDAPECAQTRTTPSGLSPVFVHWVSYFMFQISWFVFRVEGFRSLVEDGFRIRIYSGRGFIRIQGEGFMAEAIV